MTVIKRMRPILGTFVEVGLIPSTAKEIIAVPSEFSGLEPVFQKAFAAIQQIHDLLSFQNPDSDLSQLNFSPGKQVMLHPLSLRVLRLAKAMMQCSQGHFNALLGGELVRQGVLPDHGFGDVVGVGHSDDLQLMQHTACLKRPVLVSLDGIAKGFAVDYAIQQCKTDIISGGWINAGGDIRVFGDYCLPVSLHDEQGNFYDVYNAAGDTGLHKLAIATSSSKSDSRYPGLLLGGDGRSLTDSQWTVIAHKAWRADALTKVAASVPVNEREQILARLGGRLIYHCHKPSMGLSG